METPNDIQAKIESIKDFGSQPATLRALETALAEASQTGEAPHITVEEIVAAAVSYVSDPTITHWERVASASPENFWEAVEALASCGVTLSPLAGGAELVPCMEEEQDVFSLAPLPGPASVLELLKANPLVADIETELSFSPNKFISSATTTIDLKDGQQITASREFSPCSPARPDVDLEQRAADTVTHLAATKLNEAFPAETRLLENALVLQTLCYASIENTVGVFASKVSAKEGVTKAGQSLEHRATEKSSEGDEETVSTGL